nr:hypothetical protein [Tanacetum cinerariifolium]
INIHEYLNCGALNGKEPEMDTTPSDGYIMVHTLERN